MNRLIGRFGLIASLLFLQGCAVKPTVTNEYKLESFSSEKAASKPIHASILITHPDAATGYDTEEMLYTDKPFEISNFVHNAWMGPPADMLLPLMVQSLQKSGYFYAVASTATSELTDYRLDTQLLELQQNFLKKPSQLDFTAKIVLTHVSDNRIIASRIIELHVPCPSDTPYGGVIAANQATGLFTAGVTKFVLNHVKNDSH
ncbi:transport protein [Legionella quinlivanii]|uniref:Transport protein n=1 Tax=Legionella quinlivanii TaxID=45073 RepID=A0A0W0Y138_9GAMM|nr:ABC-type transport auxiliary lipoprotein family protein [Legionella quinlivanii]KTD50358.1 transport protein [Legionella quinlivanii]MCW8449891.1 ABC-type transport auxiliary lipoprotein family protein [Legionella quinlivanii]SEF42473.1 cholesterol transport system auxiliary component [Legionella quinlivanii DSM 21216]STY11958.1 ABC transporter auxiliary component [Legionella quinlivanii]